MGILQIMFSIGLVLFFVFSAVATVVVLIELIKAGDEDYIKEIKQARALNR